jgi:hypothetical protein
MRGLILLCMWGMLAGPVFAQSEADWQVLLVDWADSTLYQVTPEEVRAVALPAVPIALAASVDGRYVVFMDADYAIRVMDVQAEVCCADFVNPYLGEIAQLAGMGIGAINADGSQIAIYKLTPQPGSAYPSGEIAVITADGTILSSLLVEDLTGNASLPNPQFGYWLPEGIEIFPICTACDAAFAGQYTLWLPEIGGGGLSTDGLGVAGSYLDQTGELIDRGRDERFPIQPEIVFGPFNVLTYIANPEAEPVLIYVDAIADIPTPRWVGDGVGVVLHEFRDIQPQLIYRDGSKIDITYAGEARFLAGTPTGWLIVEEVTGKLLHYSMNADHQITVDELGVIPHPDFAATSMRYSPRLGSSMTELEFLPTAHTN